MIYLYCVIVRDSVPEPAATHLGSSEEGEKVAASGEEVLDLNNERNESEYASASQPIGLLDIPLATSGDVLNLTKAIESELKLHYLNREKEP
jgi:hypothetical protein